MQLRSNFVTKAAILLIVGFPFFHSQSGSAQNQQTPASAQHSLSSRTNYSSQQSLNKNAGGSSNIPPQIVKRFDVNQDGILDQTEMAAAKAARKERMLEKFDKNGDGNLSDEEKAQARQFMQEQQNSNKNTNNAGQMHTSKQKSQTQ
jgi:hypothetical protein